MKVLELFAGSCSFSKIAKEMGHEVFTSDIEPFDGIDYVVDILEFDYRKLPWQPDVVWASPPCTGFSVSAIGKNWKIIDGVYVPQTPTAKLGIELVKRTVFLIDFLDPYYWFMENPRGMLRKLELIPCGERTTVTYCQYGDSRQKPTDIWTNNLNGLFGGEWTPRPMCKSGDPCHIPAPRGSRTGTQGLKNAYERSRVPAELCREILLSCKL